MRKSWARFVFALVAFVAAWLVASPAQAALAPQCDARGAITFAPPPQLQPIEQSFDVDDVDPGCFDQFLHDPGLRQGSPPAPTATAPPDPVLMAGTPAILPAERAPAAKLAAAVTEPRPGARARVERPPRA